MPSLSWMCESESFIIYKLTSPGINKVFGTKYGPFFLSLPEPPLDECRLFVSSQLPYSLNFFFDTNDHYSYNDVFTLHELKQAIKLSRDTSPGIDTVYYQLLKHLPDDSLLLLLDILITFG